MNMLELVYSNRQPSSLPQRAPWAEATDRDLLMAMREGDESAPNELINRKTKPLLHLSQRILGGDLEEARDSEIPAENALAEMEQRLGLAVDELVERRLV